MKICIIGTGYIGLVSGVCFAEIGHEVICADVDKIKINSLNKGEIPIYEPGLEVMLKRNVHGGRLKFTDNIEYGIKNSSVIFIAVGTPPHEDGSADLKHVLNVAQFIAQTMTSSKMIVIKSTVPVGTASRIKNVIQKILEERGKLDLEFNVISNPEFLKEGDAISDFMRPDRIIVGVDSSQCKGQMKELYEPFVRNGHALIFMDTPSAELTKYAANAMLASRISFMNELSSLCEKVGADIEHIRKGIGTDSRIGSKFLYAGLGYGGSCFPKDVKALIQTFSEHKLPAELLNSIEKVNLNHKKIFTEKILNYYGKEIQNKMFALWGAAFKPKTDDIRESSAIEILNALLKQGCQVRIFDPEALENVKKIIQNKNVTYCHNMYDAAEGADAIILATEWSEFKNPKFDLLSSIMKSKVMFDGRNQFSPEKMSSLSWTYFGVGRGVN